MKKVIYGLLAFAPVLAFAQSLSSLTTLVGQVKSVVTSILPLLFGVAIIYFFWGLIKFIRAAGDPKAVAEGKGVMIWGIVALLVMVSVYGILAWLGQAAGINPGGTVTLPTLP